METLKLNNANLVELTNDESVNIDGGGFGNVVAVFTDWVNISSFTITHARHDLLYAGLMVLSNHNTIVHNKISYNEATGIILSNSSYNRVRENIMLNNAFYNIYLESGSDQNIIIQNSFLREEDWPYATSGLWLKHSSFNIIQGNLLLNPHSSVGIALNEGSDNNNVKKNTVLSCSMGIQISESDNNDVIDNEIKWHDGHGISMSFSDGNNIFGNIIKSNEANGIMISFCKDNDIKNNNISLNKKEGVSIACSSIRNTIQLNNIFNNYVGMEVIDLSITPHIIGNCILNKIKYNNFIGNIKMAYDNNLFSFNIWYGNYWNRSRILPKAIFGIKEYNNIKIPVIHFDLRPARKLNII